MKLPIILSTHEELAYILSKMHPIDVYKLEDIHYLEESILNLIIFASDSNVTSLPPLDGELVNLLSLVKAMRPTGDEIQLAEKAILTINS